jgi:hypothetical protein
MLRSVFCATFSVRHLEASWRAFEQWLDHRTVYSGVVEPGLAERWGAPACAGRRTVVLQPASGEDVYIRLVAAGPERGWAPLRTFGWNAAELHVRDVHTLAERLEGSPFTLVGGPRDLMDDGTAIALQVRGPSDELLYLTELHGDDIHARYGRAKSRVDRLFIVVLGNHDQRAAMDFYNPFSNGVVDSGGFPIPALAEAHGLDPETTEFRTGSVAMAGPFRIELDDYPPTALPRLVAPGDLPPGMAMVSFLVDDLSSFQYPQRPRIASMPQVAPYHGRRTARFNGPSGEWIEIVEGRWR